MSYTLQCTVLCCNVFTIDPKAGVTPPYISLVKPRPVTVVAPVLGKSSQYISPHLIGGPRRHSTFSAIGPRS